MTDDHTSIPKTETASAPAQRSIRTATLVKLILAGVVIAIVAVFVTQNSDRVELEFLSWSFRTPQFIMMLGSALAGVVVWEGFVALNRRTRRRRDKQD